MKMKGLLPPTVLYLSIGMGIITKFLAVPILRTIKINYLLGVTILRSCS